MESFHCYDNSNVHDKFSSSSNTSVVVISPNLCWQWHGDYMYWPWKTLPSHVLKKVLRVPPETVRVSHLQVINQNFTEVHSPPPPQDLQWEGIFSLFSEKIPSVFFNLLVTSQRIKTKSPRKEVKRWENANLLSKHTQWQLWFILLCTGYTLMNLEICRDIKLFKTNRCHYQWLLRHRVIAFFTRSLELMDHRKSTFECPVVFYFLEKWPVFSIIQILFLQIYGMNFSCTSCLTAVK